MGAVLGAAAVQNLGFGENARARAVLNMLQVSSVSKASKQSLFICVSTN